MAPSLLTNTNHFGVTCLDGNDNIFLTASMVNDGAGIDGNAMTTLEFAAPMHSIALDYPGNVTFELFNNGRSIYQSDQLGQGGVGNFSGLISTIAFDTVIIGDLIGGVAFYDLYFGPPIPTPGTVALFALATFAPTRRRRR